MTAQTVPPIVLVDGSAYLYRAFHALPPLTTADNRPTGAIRGVVSMLRSLINSWPDSPMAVVFDAKGKTFRDELFAEYKAHRPPMPDDLRAQIEPLHACVKALGLPLLCVEGVEADDVIGTLAHQALDEGRQVIISTGDKDMAQLVNSHVTLVNTMTNETLDSDGVTEKFGLPPERIIDYLALMGDSVDNIPGVPGVGKKTALALLTGIEGGLHTLYDDLSAVTALSFRGAKTMPKKLEEYREQAFLSYQLATIKTDCALPVSLCDLMLPAPDADALKQLFADLEFKGWLKELASGSFSQVTRGASAPLSAAVNPTVNPAASTAVSTTDSIKKEEQPSTGETAAPQGALFDDDTSSEAGIERPLMAQNQYHTVRSLDELHAWVARLEQSKRFCFDLETTSLNYMEADIVGIGLGLTAGEAAYVPVAHDYIGAPDQLDRREVLGLLQPLFENAAIGKLGHNLKYDMEVLARYAIRVEGPLFDTMLMSYVLNSTANRHDMDSLALAHLGHTTISFEDVAGKGAKQLTFNQVALEDAAPYACEDIDVTLRLYEALAPRIAHEGTLGHVLDTLDTPLIPVLAQIERNGVKIDAAALEAQSAALAADIQQCEQDAYALAGREFNLGSPKQLGEILFDEQKIPVLKKTPKGAPSTAEAVLEELALDYPLPKVIMKHRGLSKLKSTYTDKLPQLVDHQQRVHTSYHQAVTATGRLSSSDPNLQNIPVRTALGRQIRKAFVAREGYRIVAADYSQIELRIMAHLSGDEGLLAAFAHDQDIHSATAAEVFGVPLKDVTGEQRRSAKAINFGLIYGMSAWGLARQLRIERSQAQLYIERYFDRYPGVARFMDDIRRHAAEQGYVETVFGRRLYVPDITARQHNRRQAAERTAINAPMQGTAADIIKRAMIDVHHWLRDTQQDALMVMQVHDELVFEVNEHHVEAFIREVRARMEAAGDLDVALVVDARAGRDWDEAH